jgi:hypothetical protein
MTANFVMMGSGVRIPLAAPCGTMVEHVEGSVPSTPQYPVFFSLDVKAPAWVDAGRISKIYPSNNSALPAKRRPWFDSLFSINRGVVADYPICD